ncbi:DMT family transporter [Patescibacteria group bacterium]|nr:DMT family transporter [Patescibacteria group bacterium]
MNPILALIVANVIWGAASPIFKFAFTNIPPFTLAFLRFFLAGLIFVPFCIGHWQKLTLRQWLELMLVAFFGISLNISFYFIGLETTQSINAPIIASSAPIIIYALSIVFLGEKPKSKKTFGMLISLLGVLVIIFSPFFFGGQRMVLGEIKGNILIFISNIGAVLQTLFGKDSLKKINAYQASLITFLAGSLFFIPYMNTELKTWSFSQLNSAGLIGIVFGVVLCSALAYFLFYYGLSKIDAGDAGIFTYIDPVAAVVIAIPLLHEYPDLFYFLGSFLVFGGIYLAEGRIHWHPFHLLKKMEKNVGAIDKKILVRLAELANKTN